MFVVRHEGEPFDKMRFRFRRGVEAAGILREARRRRHFVPRHEERRQKIARAERRRLRAARRGRGSE